MTVCTPAETNQLGHELNNRRWRQRSLAVVKSGSRITRISLEKGPKTTEVGRAETSCQNWIQVAENRQLTAISRTTLT